MKTQINQYTVKIFKDYTANEGASIIFCDTTNNHRYELYNNSNKLISNILKTIYI